MEVLIRLERIEPPAGTVVTPPQRSRPDAGAGLPFVGWLGLLRVLAEVVRAASDQAEGG